MSALPCIVACTVLVGCMTAGQSSESDLRARRLEMVEQQIRQRGVTDARVLDAMRTVPRERFVPPELLPQAYDDGPLPIGAGQTISQPYIVAYMTEVLERRPARTRCSRSAPAPAIRPPCSASSRARSTRSRSCRSWPAAPKRCCGR